ncbi:MAG: M48 family metallopeptidase [Bacteroidetes bacterium]|nr:M48 family metallopeptidase [Bacteroidota bacterium]MBS1670901.1 M48 family metallopeptidase [Bacteroidota bacterium]
MQTIRVANFDIDVMYKEIKNVHLSVYPPTGRVTISAPLHMTSELLKVYAISKIAWIKKQQKQLQSQEREPEKEFVNRETHYFKGKRYLLKLENTKGKSYAEIKHKKLVCYTKPDKVKLDKLKAIDAFYRAFLNQTIPSFIQKWEKELGVKVAEYGIKKMKTKWGTCNPVAKRIWVNIELAKKPVHCLEYIVVHEMVHLLERKHNDKFTAHLNKHLPNWKAIKRELNELPVGV